MFVICCDLHRGNDTEPGRGNRMDNPKLNEPTRNRRPFLILLACVAILVRLSLERPRYGIVQWVDVVATSAEEPPSVANRKRWESIANQTMQLVQQRKTCSWRKDWECHELECETHEREVPTVASLDPAPSCKTLWFVGMSEKSFSQEIPRQSYAALYLAGLESAFLHSHDVLQPVLMLNEFGNTSSNILESSIAKIASSRGAIVVKIDELSIQSAIDTLFQAHTDGHRIGPFMRMDIPHVIRKELLFERPGICDKYVLYTDSDVLFPNPISHQDMQLLKETLKHPAMALYGREYGQFPHIVNTGVMLIDVPSFEAELPDIVAFGLEKGTPFEAFDQGWLNEYFALHEHKRALLPIYWNWKAYWSVEPSTLEDIKIIHYHGPKPGRCLDNIAQCDPPDKTCPIEPYLFIVRDGVCCDNGRTALMAIDMMQQLLNGMPVVSR